MKRLTKAFTLTELLVALGVIAVLCAILLPVIFNLMPNQNTIMAKRAYYTVNSVVADLINDEACYPDRTTAETPRLGFDDPVGSVNCIDWNEENIDETAEKMTRKFLTLFRSKLGINPPGEGETWDEFKTKDGMVWKFTDANFDSPTGESPTDEQKMGGHIRLTVDVNGEGTPNCGQDSTDENGSQSIEFTGDNGSDCSTRTNGFDRFQMIIRGNGQIEIPAGDIWAVNAVKVDRNITGSKNSNADDGD